MNKLNLGCGHKKRDGFINADIRKDIEADLIFDAVDGLPVKDNSLNEIMAFDFLEHLPLGKTIFLIEEVWRALKSGGKFEHFTPSTEGNGAFQDPTHLSFWNLNSWLYFSETQINKEYGIKARFRVEVLRDIKTDHKVIHTHGIMHKDQST